MQFFVLLLPLCYGLAVSAWLALMIATDALRCVLLALVVTTATVGQKSKFGLSGAWDYSSYSYWFKNYGSTGGFCGGGSCFKELCWCIFRNLAYFG